jgi:hypothetical protein
LARDVSAVSQMPDEKDQVAWIKANGFRLRGAHSGGHYKPQMKAVDDAVKAFLAEPASLKALGAPGTPVHTAFAANLQVDSATAGGKDHNAFVGENDNLRKALETMP